MQRENHKFIQGEAFDLVENLSDNKKKHLLVFVDSCEKNHFPNNFLKLPLLEDTGFEILKII